jgi:hypothetical protein
LRRAVGTTSRHRCPLPCLDVIVAPETPAGQRRPSIGDRRPGEREYHSRCQCLPRSVLPAFAGIAGMNTHFGGTDEK